MEAGEAKRARVAEGVAKKSEQELDLWQTAMVDPIADFSSVRIVFGYGSMCFRQDFPFVRAFPACVRGFHRRFWQLSCDHRGTPEAPGRVLTLVRADTTGQLENSGNDVVHGVAFEIADADWNKVLADLDFRERHGYIRTVVDVMAPGEESNAIGRAIVYYAYRPETSKSYIGPEDIVATAAVIDTAEGPSGKNDAYLFRLVSSLAEWGLPAESYLIQLADEVKRLQRNT